MATDRLLQNAIPQFMGGHSICAQLQNVKVGGHCSGCLCWRLAYLAVAVRSQAWEWEASTATSGNVNSKGCTILRFPVNKRTAASMNPGESTSFVYATRMYSLEEIEEITDNTSHYSKFGWGLINFPSSKPYSTAKDDLTDNLGKTNEPSQRLIVDIDRPRDLYSQRRGRCSSFNPKCSFRASAEWYCKYQKRIGGLADMNGPRFRPPNSR